MKPKSIISHKPILRKKRLDFLEGNKYVLFARARSGLYHVIRASLVSNVSNVVMSSYSLPDLATVLNNTGAEIRYADLDDNSLNYSLNSYDKLIDENTSAVVWTNYNFQHFDVIVCIARKYPNIKIIIDDAIGFTLDVNRYPSEVDAVVLSFSSFKLINAIWGGVVIYMNDSLELPNINNKLGLSKYLEQGIKVYKYRLFTNSQIYSILTSFTWIRKKLARGTKFGNFKRSETEEIDITFTSTPAKFILKAWERSYFNAECRLSLRRRNWFYLHDRLAPYCIERVGDITNCSARFYPIMFSSVEAKLEFIETCIVDKQLDVGSSIYGNLAQQEKDLCSNTNLICSLMVYLPVHERFTNSDLEAYIELVEKYNQQLIKRSHV